MRVLSSGLWCLDSGRKKGGSVYFFVAFLYEFRHSKSRCWRVEGEGSYLRYLENCGRKVSVLIMGLLVYPWILPLFPLVFFVFAALLAAHSFRLLPSCPSPPAP